LSTLEITRLFTEAEYYKMQGLLELIRNTPIMSQLNSTIISARDYIKLNPSLGFQVEQMWKLIYRGSVDGFGAADFHRKCDGVANTLTVIKSSSGNIFGGYTNAAWDTSNSWKGDSGAFIFSFKDKMYLRLNVRRTGFSIYCTPSVLALFGGRNDILISDQCNKSTNSFSNLGHTYELPTGLTFGSDAAQSFLAGSYHFQVEEIEVFTKI
jgi:hypothetical protein